MPYLAATPAEGRPSGGGTTYLTIPGVEAGAASTQTLTANTVRYEPFYVSTPITIDQLVLEVSTVGAGGTTVRVGIYNCDANLQPTSLVLDAGTVTADSQAVKTLSVNVTLPTGRYLFAVNSDGTPVLRSVRGGARMAGYATGLGTAPYLTAFQIAQTYAAFPATGLAWTTAASGGGSPFQHTVFCRISAP